MSMSKKIKINSSVMTKSSLKTLTVSILTLCISSGVIARENVGVNGHKQVVNQNTHKVQAGCTPATAQTDLDINNVRTTILTGGDMWWNLSDGKYEIPKGGKKHSLFAGALWVGGVDAGNNLKVAAMTYRQNGNDFWPGPLNVNDVSITDDRCAKYDRHFQITKEEVDKFISDGTMTNNIASWPGNGDANYGETDFLAPFYDKDGDTRYSPASGDYPLFYDEQFGNCKEGAYLYGDKALWWVFNDKGNIHSETGGQQIGLEVHAQAFAFSTNDAINDMTFYQYHVFNRSTLTLNETYFGQWVDPDLGNYQDDFVGCDVREGVGFVYNGDDDDESTAGYGTAPPCLGADFFQGPRTSLADGFDNDGDGLVDEDDNPSTPEMEYEECKMSYFVYYNNDAQPTGNPSNVTHYYNYLRGIWKDGTPMEYGGTGYAPSGSTTGQICRFMFPSNSDPSGTGFQFPPRGNNSAIGTGIGTPNSNNNNWSEDNNPNTPGDRRFLQSAGPFTLQPGAANFVTVGLVWAQASSRKTSVDAMKAADKKAQFLFNTCFQKPEGPHAPDLTIQELDKELILMITNPSVSNNKDEYFSLFSKDISTLGELYQSPNAYGKNPLFDSTYNFEGYKIYQLRSNNITGKELGDDNKARLVFQCDIKNGVSKAINFDKYDPSVQGDVAKLMVNGEDKGIRHTVSLTRDAFTGGPLINFKNYYFMAVAYAYNNYKNYKEDAPPKLDQPFIDDSYGQKIQYIESVSRLKVYPAIPHKPASENGGTVMHSKYGDEPKITRVEGWGNGGNILDLSKEVEESILSNGGRLSELTYEKGFGPIKVKVIDPLNVPNADFEVKFDRSLSLKYTITNLATGDTVHSDREIMYEYEQLIPKWGISVTITQLPKDNYPTRQDTLTSYYKPLLDGCKLELTDETKPWLSGIPDSDQPSPLNWIRAGAQADGNYDNYVGMDDDELFEQLIGGSWAPYPLCAKDIPGGRSVGAPAFDDPVHNKVFIKRTNGIDVVFTSDKTKWTRCPVIELCDESDRAVNNTPKLDARRVKSVDKNGKTVDEGAVSGIDNPEAADYISANGMGWFPGYAINVETGERLNMAFGENSWIVSENGNDMVWNPTSTISINPGSSSYSNLKMGGMHYIYVFNNTKFLVNGSATDSARVNFDNGKFLIDHLYMPANLNVKRDAMNACMWVGLPLLAEGRKLLETDARIKLRVAVPYYTGYSINQTASNPVNYNYPAYKFDTKDLYTELNNSDAAKKALDLIRVVPNPYYAFSQYEFNQLDNRVKITNLPFKCNIKIYNLNGTLVYKYSKDDPTTSVDWLLKNEAGIPIASGMYLVHVSVDGVGEKVLKAMMMMRPIDLDNF